MTLEELVIAVQVTADGAEETINGLRAAFERFAQAGESGLLGVQREVKELVKWISFMRHVGKASAQEEIALLEAVKASSQMTLEEQMDIEKRLYDAKEKLREAEAEKITDLHDALTEALQNQYEEQQKAEQGRISQSIASWQTWSETTCAAIRKQINALDEQAEAENRAALEKEHLRKMAELRQALDYEKDAYNQQQLVKQMEQAEAAWEKTQKGWAQADQRSALEAQLAATQQQAQAEIAALQKESARIDEVYSAMTEGQKLAAEAQKLLMEQSQEELLALLSAYAPDYEATGRTLGEKIYAGFQAAFGDVSAFFDGFDAQFEQMAQAAQRAALQKAEGVQLSGETAAVTGHTINQTVNFNQPVDSPADVTRRMQQVSYELAGMI